jgi:hypothetical protein
MVGVTGSIPVVPTTNSLFFAVLGTPLPRSSAGPCASTANSGLWHQRDQFLRFGRKPSSTALCLCFCTLHTSEILRTDQLVQADNRCVVDLDIGRANRTSARSEWSTFRSAPTTAGKALSLPVVRRPIAKEQHKGRGFESFTEGVRKNCKQVSVSLPYRGDSHDDRHDDYT